MAGGREAEEITVSGIVQGVGFRPFVYRLARRLGLAGHVRNVGDRVVIRAAGARADLDAFAAALRAEAPPLARVEQLSRAPASVPAEEDFRILASGAGTVSAGVAPDVATCPACLAEMADPQARRFRYAFTNCTDCGPRFSIVAGLPYDRPATTMAAFAMCPECAAEYADPADRRFHAQPIACPRCGPRVWLEGAEGSFAAAVAGDADAPASGRDFPGVRPSSGPSAAREAAPVAGAGPDRAFAAMPPFPGAPAACDAEPGAAGPDATTLGAVDAASPRRAASAADGALSAKPLFTGRMAAPKTPCGSSVPEEGAAAADVRARRAQGCSPPAGGPAPDGSASPQPGVSTLSAEMRAAQAAPAEEPITAAAALLRRGAILAVKGIGGFHIACDATDAVAVAELRRRKHRPTKPLAVMATREMAARLCFIGPAEAEAVAAPSAPIVLLEMRDPAALAPGIAPGQRHVGVMLPYSPLHHLLLEAAGRPLVMTSGNRAGAPQAIEAADARASLAGIVDGFLMHDRPIARRLDDSVVRLAAGRVRVLRRGRGLAPMPLALPEDFAGARPVLALGAELKSAICLTHGAKALLSHHLGDLDAPDTIDAFEAALSDYAALFAHAPAAVAVDLHPGYRATRVGAGRAEALGLPLVGVAHHHAHMAAAMAEAGWRRGDGPVVGLVLDGLGLGEDGVLRGAEILVGDYVAAQRAGSLSAIALMGGDVASREPWRVLLAHLDRALGRHAVDGDPALAALFAGRPAATLRAMADKGLNAPQAHSAGRLFDAVAALLGLAPERLSHEGEAAMALEACADMTAEPYPFAVREPEGILDIDPTPLWRALLADRAAGRPAGAMSGAFHRGLAHAFADAAARVARRGGIGAVALSGGVFQNALLLEETEGRLAGHGLRVLSPTQVPAGDGGLALGQAVVAAARLMA
ncbi:carbamoyltransferase HypF [Xanthobacter sp. V0B-10]|uniref:carbamoyltransferase HypF n=1 Tax=Xanthobacter albus TaxID=3119929 RepID=UPI003728C8AD